MTSERVPAAAPDEDRGPWTLVAALAITQTVSWGVLYYAFAVLQVPMQRDLGLSPTELTGAFSIGLLVSGIAAIGVGRFLDAHAPRGLMTAGSGAGAALVVVWSQIDGGLGLYLVWTGIGAVMATVLYEPAFVVLAKSFPIAAQRRRALTAVTLLGATASFVFMPLTQALSYDLGWRSALLVLALILALVTVPLHGLSLPGAAVAAERRGTPDVAGVDTGTALRSLRFWLLATAFFLAAFVALAMLLHTIPFLIERGHDPAFAVFAVGLVGIAQIPGRLLFGPLETALPPAAATAGVFLLVGTGVVLTATAQASLVVVGLAFVGAGNGMTTLARATVIATDYGTAAYGTIAGVLAATTTAARAAGPICGALVATALGYTVLLWLLASLVGIAAAFGWLARGTGPQSRLVVS